MTLKPPANGYVYEPPWSMAGPPGLGASEHSTTSPPGPQLVYVLQVLLVATGSPNGRVVYRAGIATFRSESRGGSVENARGCTWVWTLLSVIGHNP